MSDNIDPSNARLYDILTGLSSQSSLTFSERISNHDARSSAHRKRFAQLAAGMLSQSVPHMKKKRRLGRSVDEDDAGKEENEMEIMSKGHDDDDDDGNTTSQDGDNDEPTAAAAAAVEGDKKDAKDKKLQVTTDEESKQKVPEAEVGCHDIVGKIKRLRSLYLYGLEQVSRLQDLRDAPDAILPGNFVIPDKEAAPSSMKESDSGTAKTESSSKQANG